MRVICVGVKCQKDLIRIEISDEDVLNNAIALGRNYACVPVGFELPRLDRSHDWRPPNLEQIEAILANE